jgi:hypothetical protein
MSLFHSAFAGYNMDMLCDSTFMELYQLGRKYRFSDIPNADHIINNLMWMYGRIKRQKPTVLTYDGLKKYAKYHKEKE